MTMKDVPDRHIDPPIEWEEEPEEDEEEIVWYDWFDPRGVKIV